jgi:hypothetical protein
MRRSPLQARTPLRRLTPLAAKATPKATRVKPAVPAEVRELLAARSGGWCEAQLVGCTGTATDAHHRVTQKAGGRSAAAKAAHDRLSNLVHLDRTCHDWIGARPAEAYDLGLSLKEGQDPAKEPVVYRGELSYLTDDGQVFDFAEVGT